MESAKKITTLLAADEKKLCGKLDSNRLETRLITLTPSCEGFSFIEEPQHYQHPPQDQLNFENYVIGVVANFKLSHNNLKITEANKFNVMMA